MYHRFGADRYPSTSVTLAQFEAHLDELQRGGYAVLPVHTILSALRAGEALPDRTVGITVDDAYRSLYDEGWPRLKAAGFPFTVFVATEAVDRGGAGFMSWDELRELSEHGVEIGSQAVTHPHMADIDAEQNRQELRDSALRIAQEIGQAPRYFAYPYGEASAEVKELVVEAGYEAAFGQHSGVIHRRADFLYLPRFGMNEAFAGIDRFRRVVDTLPLPIEDLTPDDPLIHENPPAIGFTLPARLLPMTGLACYHSRFGRLDSLERLGDRRVEIRFDEPFPEGRNRLNCTAPAAGGRWRWFGMQYYVPPGG